jgi:hypothetical protein
MEWPKFSKKVESSQAEKGSKGQEIEMCQEFVKTEHSELEKKETKKAKLKKALIVISIGVLLAYSGSNIIKPYQEAAKQKKQVETILEHKTEAKDAVYGEKVFKLIGDLESIENFDVRLADNKYVEDFLRKLAVSGAVTEFARDIFHNGAEVDISNEEKNKALKIIGNNINSYIDQRHGNKGGGASTGEIQKFQEENKDNVAIGELLNMVDDAYEG